MEFKFRSIHERSSTFFTHSPAFPPPPNFSYFTQQAMRAGFTTPDDQTHWEFHRNSKPNLPDFQEAMQMQRQLEKERIRAEIIAEEIARRRILEEEVRREMMMERELGVRFGPMRMESRTPLLANFEHRERFCGIGVSPHREMGFCGFETLPFQRDPVALGSGVGGGNRTPSSVVLQDIKTPVQGTGKEKVTILAKPTITSVADLKRKIATQAEGSTAELIYTGSKKQKTKDDWSCALCRISATSERGFKDHLEGKKHKARERGLLAQKTGFGTSPLPKKNKHLKTGFGTSPLPKKNKHPKTPGLENSPISKNKDEKPQGRKDDIFQQRKEKSLARKKNQKGNVPKKTLVGSKPKKKFTYWCEVCQIGAYSQSVMDAHKNGKKHLRNLSDANPSETAMVNAASEETKQERAEENAGIVENNPKTITDGMDHKVLENACTDVTFS